MKTASTLPPTIEFAASYVGRLSDFDLGSSSGIVSPLTTPAQVEAFRRHLPAAMQPITDKGHFSCIDGRRCLKNGDNSAPVIRARQVAGSGVLMATMYDGGIMPLPVSTPPLMALRQLELTCGVAPSAHTGECGGLNGAIIDAEAVAQQPQIAATLQAIVSLPQVLALSQGAYVYSAASMQAIAQRAAKRAAWLRAANWQGAQYVDDIAQRDPAGLEVLRADVSLPHHGHAEQAIVLVASSDYSLSEAVLAQWAGNAEAFVVNIGTAAALAGRLAPSQDVARDSFLANIALHLAVANRLPAPNMPLYLLAPLPSSA